MEFKEYKKELVEHLRKSVQLFSPKKKKDLELWVVRELLDVLGVAYTESELQHSKDEPPDVTFRNANFEIIELYDEGRKRHDEYKTELKKAEDASDYSDIGEVVTWDISPLSLTELLSMVEDYLESKKGRYDPVTKACLDVLMYVNLQKKTVADEDYMYAAPLPQNSPLREWRSVALVFNGQKVCVLHSSISLPEIIRTSAGNFVRK